MIRRVCQSCRKTPLAMVIATLAITAGGVLCAQQTPRGDVEMSEPLRREIALSFDDAPRPDGTLLSGAARTARLIEALDRAKVEGAGFFVLTGNIPKTGDGAERLKAYQKAGHVLANHTHTHPSLNKTDIDFFLSDVDKAAEVLSGFDDKSNLFRFPYLREGDTGAKHGAAQEGLADRGLRNAYVTVDNYDWYLQALVDEAVAAGHVPDRSVLAETYVELLVDAVEFYDALAQRTLGRSPRHVLLLHENDLAALFVDDLVVRLRELGWTIIPITEAYEDEIADSAPDTLFNNQGRVAALAHAAGVEARSLVHAAEDEDYLRKLFRDRGLLPSE
ncbi:polysaccharide deacetylase family protein [Roseobacter sp.]|uniref:polysaccharide deacetylase family protein n=1 Tax=Roseobacter sp. TaxID=1907202 RepID=UPI00296779A9|nr:polysaccharide deacetylase family protein [Roseobacter sp.]MDW3180773.1 polysaccharide deacetylase family protein [Roseobacter sp.]